MVIFPISGIYLSYCLLLLSLIILLSQEKFRVFSMIKSNVELPCIAILLPDLTGGGGVSTVASFIHQII